MPPSGREHINLNLLRIFNALYLTGNMTHAARRLGISQPAVSQALGKLREKLNDPLLVRSKGGLVATDRGYKLGDGLDNLLERLEGKCYPPELFVPLEYNGQITLALSGVLMNSLSPAITDLLTHVTHPAEPAMLSA